MQQHIAGAIDAHIQTVAAAIAVATVAGITREGMELWLSRWDMIVRNGTRTRKPCQAFFRSELTKPNSFVNNPRVNTDLSTTPIAITLPRAFSAADTLASARNEVSMCRRSPCCPT